MPTTAEPSKQAPMQAVVDLASQKTLDSGPVVTRQPVGIASPDHKRPNPPEASPLGPDLLRAFTDRWPEQTLEPRPEAEPVLGLRGGGLSCGFDCCLGSCRFHKACC
ncbi:hypothetical protein VD0004_g7207 [Verticillium dahliae]|nr:hypothetical protein VD0004_g7207 [Verticillium dahliae]